MNNILAIDVGNTNAKWGLFVNGKLSQVNRVKTAEVGVHAASILDFALGYVPAGSVRAQRTDGKRPRRNQTGPPRLKSSLKSVVALSSVVPAATAAIMAECRMRRIDVVEVTPASQKVFPDMHPEMGADRISDLVAAWSLYRRSGSPLIVIGLGTASTMLAVDQSGSIVGGFIAPGVQLLFDILHQRCALLPDFTLEGATAAVGNTTETQIKNGVLLTVSGMVTAWVNAGQQALGHNGSLQSKPIVVGTGGWAVEMAGHDASLFDVVDRDLALRGAYLIAMSHLARTKTGTTGTVQKGKPAA